MTRRELLAVVFFTKYFRSYLLGRQFTIRTDHSALRWLRSTPEPIGQQARWLERLEEFSYTVEHRPGNKHGNADALSRRPCRQCSRGEHGHDLEAADRVEEEREFGSVLRRARIDNEETARKMMDEPTVNQNRAQIGSEETARKMIDEPTVNQSRRSACNDFMYESTNVMSASDLICEKSANGDLEYENRADEQGDSEMSAWNRRCQSGRY